MPPSEKPAPAVVPDSIPDQNSPTNEPPKVDAERYAQLSRREKAIRTEHVKLQKERQAVEEMKAKQQGYMSAAEYKAKLLSDPTSMGISAEELSGLTMQQLNADPRDAAIAELRREVQALKGGVDETKNAMQQSQTKAVDQALKQISREVTLLVDSNDAYEMIKLYGSQEAVVTLIKETYDQEGIILSNEEAAQKVEDYLFDQSLKVAAAKKVQSKLAPTPAVAEPTSPLAALKPTITPKQTITTLTHAGTPPAPTSMSAKDRRTRAILAYQGKLTG